MPKCRHPQLQFQLICLNLGVNKCPRFYSNFCTLLKILNKIFKLCKREWDSPNNIVLEIHTVWGGCYRIWNTNEESYTDCWAIWHTMIGDANCFARNTYFHCWFIFIYRAQRAGSCFSCPPPRCTCCASRISSMETHSSSWADCSDGGERRNSFHLNLALMSHQQHTMLRVQWPMRS